MFDDVEDLRRAFSVIMVVALILTAFRSYLLMIVLGAIHSVFAIIPPLGFFYSLLLVLLADFIASMIRFNSK